MVLKKARVEYWASVGAQPTERVVKLLAEQGVREKPEVKNNPKQATPKKRAQERLKAEAAAQSV